MSRTLDRVPEENEFDETFTRLFRSRSEPELGDLLRRSDIRSGEAHGASDRNHVRRWRFETEQRSLQRCFRIVERSRSSQEALRVDSCIIGRERGLHRANRRACSCNRSDNVVDVVHVVERVENSELRSQSRIDITHRSVERRYGAIERSNCAVFVRDRSLKCSKLRSLFIRGFLTVDDHLQLLAGAVHNHKAGRSRDVSEWYVMPRVRSFAIGDVKRSVYARLIGTRNRMWSS